MANIAIANFLSGSDSTCWKEAITLHNAGLKKGKLSKKYIGDAATSGQPTSASELMETALSSYSRRKQKCGKVATVLMGIRFSLHRFSSTIDVFIQCDPSIAAIVWGSVRILLKISEDEEEATQIAGEGIMEILRQVERWEQAAEICHLLNSPSVLNSSVFLYTRVLDFLMASTSWLKKNLLNRLGTSMFAPKIKKFEEKLHQMRIASDLLDKEIQTRATKKSLRQMQEVGVDIRTSMDKIDGYMVAVNQLCDNAKQLLLANQRDSTGQNTTFEVVLAELKDLPTRIANTALDKMQDKIDLTDVKTWLSQVVTETSLIVHPAENTCKWILQDPTYISWVASQDHSALWTYGHYGCGKSVMARFLQDHYCSQGETTLFYRFQRSGSATNSTPTSCLCCLILQLLAYMGSQARPQDTVGRLRRLATQFPVGPQQCPFSTILEITSSLLSQVGEQYYLILDALDECSFEGPSLPSMTQFLNRLFGAVWNTEGKVLIFTRSEPKFMAIIGNGRSIEMGGDSSLPDIMAVSAVQYEKLDLPRGERDTVMDIIRSSAQGSFQWTCLYLDHLAQALRADDFQCRLNSLPPSVREIYEQALFYPAAMPSNAQIRCRGDLLFMILSAQRSLRVSEVAEGLSILSSRVDSIVELCRPLIVVDTEYFRFSHPSVREFIEVYDHDEHGRIGASFPDSHEVLAEKCLASLTRQTYADLERIGEYLRDNFSWEESNDGTVNNFIYTVDAFYDYGAKYWIHHLIHIKSPAPALLQQVDEFLCSFQFIFWHEYLRKHFGQYHFAHQFLSKIFQWRQGVSSTEEEVVFDLESPVLPSYTQLSEAFEAQGGDDGMMRKNLALTSLGELYYFFSAHQKMLLLREKASLGFCQLYGPRHPLSLMARSKCALAHLCLGNLQLAWTIYSELATIQRDLFGPDSMAFLETVAYKTKCLHSMTEFAEASVSFTRLSADCLRLLGLDSWQYLAAQLWFAISIGQLGHLDQSCQILQSIVVKRESLYGDGDSFKNYVQAALAGTLQLLGRDDDAIANLQVPLEDYQHNFPRTDICRLDAELTLAKAYIATGKHESASAILDDIDAHVDFDPMPERAYVAAHLRGLILAKKGAAQKEQIDKAIHLLQNTLFQIEPHHNSRPLLWIRLDLADLLRQRDSEGDREKASFLFTNLLREVSDDINIGPLDEPNSSRLLRIAEEALRLIRAYKHNEARNVLREAQVEWERPSDFWLISRDGLLFL